MIFGIGTDITEVARFERWLANPSMIERFFNENELFTGTNQSAACQHYAVRFAAKEAFSKALGTGLTGFDLRDVYIEKTDNGRPVLTVRKTAQEQLEKNCGRCKLFVSLSHEKEYATAVVVIETGE